MIRPGFLNPALRKDPTDLARDGSVAHRLARRANALVLLDQGAWFKMDSLWVTPKVARAAPIKQFHVSRVTRI